MSNVPDATCTDLAAAATRLEISPDATRNWLERGLERAEKRAEHWYVGLPDLDGQLDTPATTGHDSDRRVDAESDAVSGQPDTIWPPRDAVAFTARELIDQLKEETSDLRDQLDQRSRELAAERERFDVLHREALARIPAHSAGQDAPPAARAVYHVPEPTGVDAGSLGAVVAIVGAVAVSTVAEQRARALLVQHGIDPHADVDDLTALLEARGWRVSLEHTMGRGRGQGQRWSGHATLVAPPGSSAFRRAEHVRINGVSGQEVLTRILAKVLEKEEKA